MCADDYLLTLLDDMEIILMENYNLHLGNLGRKYHSYARNNLMDLSLL